MAKGKGGKSKGFVSQGLNSNVNRKTLNSMKRARTGAEKAMYKVDAYWAGKNPWVTIDNPNPNETNKRSIRVKANTLWGSPKDRLNPPKKKA